MTFSFEKLGGALQHVADGMTGFVQSVIGAQKMLLHVINAGSLAASGRYSDALTELKAVGSEYGLGTGAVIGAVVGGAFGGVPGAALGATLGGAAGSVNKNFNAPGMAGLVNQALIARNAKQVAIEAGNRLGINPEMIYRQWEFETDSFRTIAGSNNLGGIAVPGPTDKGFQNFKNLNEFLDSYVNILSGSRYHGIEKPKNLDEFGNYLARGHYYTKGNQAPTEEMIRQYISGMKAEAGMGRVASDGPTIGQLVINVGESASVQAIKRAVVDSVSAALKKTNQRNQQEFAGSSY